jgi:MerR family redox-sensitive transcriptional activator SoxR
MTSDTPCDEVAAECAALPAVLTIGQMSDRSGVATSALRFYETKGLIHSTRNAGGQRQYQRDELRRVSFVLAAQRVGLSLDEISEVLSSLPGSRVPTRTDWARLATSWQPRLDEQIAILQRLRDRLAGCIGCGCLSLSVCRLYNPDDVAATTGSGPRYVLAEPTS